MPAILSLAVEYYLSTLAAYITAECLAMDHGIKLASPGLSRSVVSVLELRGPPTSPTYATCQLRYCLDRITYETPEGCQLIVSMGSIGSIAKDVKIKKKAPQGSPKGLGYGVTVLASFGVQ